MTLIRQLKLQWQYKKYKNFQPERKEEVNDLFVICHGF